MVGFPSNTAYFFTQKSSGPSSARSLFLSSEEDFITAPIMVGFPSICLIFGTKVERMFLFHSIFLTSERGFNSCTNHGRVSLRCVLFLVPKTGGCSSAHSLFLTIIKRISYLHQWRLCFPLMHLILAPNLSGCSSARSFFLTIRKRV